jgi:GNAT superfamily N-acetyltransferase
VREATIRQAEARDAPLLAWAMQEAARSHLPRGLWDLAFPGDEAERLWLLQQLALHPVTCHCHYGGFLIAERDGEPVATLSGYEPLVKTEARLREAVVDATLGAGWSDQDLEALEPRLSPFMHVRPELASDAWTLEAVAVRPEHRGSGVFDALMEAILDEGRRRGYVRSQLVLMLGNERAERAYARHGFAMVSARSHPSMQEVLGCPGVGRMTATL